MTLLALYQMEKRSAFRALGLAGVISIISSLCLLTVPL